MASVQPTECDEDSNESRFVDPLDTLVRDLQSLRHGDEIIIGFGEISLEGRVSATAQDSDGQIQIYLQSESLHRKGISPVLSNEDGFYSIETKTESIEIEEDPTAITEVIRRRPEFRVWSNTGRIDTRDCLEKNRYPVLSIRCFQDRLGLDGPDSFRDVATVCRVMAQ